MLGKISTGAQNDLERVTRMAYSQVALYGMNPKIGLLSYPPEDGRIDKPYSEDTAKVIDTEVRQLVDVAYKRTKEMMIQKKDLVEKMAQSLLDKEVLNLEELEQLLGKRPFKVEGLRNIDKYAGGFGNDTDTPHQSNNPQVQDDPAVETYAAQTEDAQITSENEADDKDDDPSGTGSMKPSSVRKKPKPNDGTLKPGTIVAS
jgi:hypothetical protein